ncbi:MAG: VOC family protein [Jiangellaceae bacterium]
MFGNTKAFSGFAVDDLAKAKAFYTEILGLNVSDLDEQNGLIALHFPQTRDILVYVSPSHSPASYTVLNFPVPDVDAAVDQLTERGVPFERYDGFGQDEKGISRGNGPMIAWFKDPAGNIMAVIEEQ